MAVKAECCSDFKRIFTFNLCRTALIAASISVAVAAIVVDVVFENYRFSVAQPDDGYRRAAALIGYSLDPPPDPALIGEPFFRLR